MRDQPLRRPAACSVGWVCLAWARGLEIHPTFVCRPLRFLGILTPPSLLFYAAFWLLEAAEAGERSLLQHLFQGKVHPAIIQGIGERVYLAVFALVVLIAVAGTSLAATPAVMHRARAPRPGVVKLLQTFDGRREHGG